MDQEAALPTGTVNSTTPTCVFLWPALAVRQNPHLSAVARGIGAARSGVRSARALTNPSVTFTPGLTSVGGSGEKPLLQGNPK